MSQLEPKIYVACLAAYNSGTLYGKWIDANQDVSSLECAIQKMLAKSPVRDAEEWAIHDYDDFYPVELSEWPGLETISEIAAFIFEHGELGAELVNYVNNDVENAERTMEEEYYGAYKSEKDFACEHFNETIRGYFEELIREYDSKGISFLNDLMVYVDYESYAKDFFMSDFFSLEVGDKTHIFRNT